MRHSENSVAEATADLADALVRMSPEYLSR
ncbi:hypothetical protein JOF48_003021 [Arthrobacter stackebrandtii]|uniref:Uncharacterized protein n=1 Tax=Arthrobacter stackebrandtii TaxID=272161 RepID=A0ABS4Z0H9_9MICC|nr:hypothetical protein [Arthrobacter stackebrandtii]